MPPKPRNYDSHYLWPGHGVVEIIKTYPLESWKRSHVVVAWRVHEVELRFSSLRKIYQPELRRELNIHALPR